jgi:spore coat polysaccharide biosynthesis protein SpsF
VAVYKIGIGKRNTRKGLQKSNSGTTTNFIYMNFKTDQEKFWAGEFGNNYINRNNSNEYLASNLNFFSKTFAHCPKPKSIIEFGANIGMNLRAIQLLFPDIEVHGIEINQTAVKQLAAHIGNVNVTNTSIFDFEVNRQYEIALIKGVLIHINPNMLPIVYEKLYQSAEKYILVCEYYNPSPVSVPYRGHEEKLFKRDFAGELMQKYPNLKLADYGFVYKNDPVFPQDDVTWFLLSK